MELLRISSSFHLFTLFGPVTLNNLGAGVTNQPVVVIAVEKHKRIGAPDFPQPGSRLDPGIIRKFLYDSFVGSTCSTSSP